MVVFKRCVESHHPKHLMVIGITGKVINVTLNAFPINVPTDEFKLEINGERNFSSKTTMGKRTSNTSMVCFHAGGNSPVWAMEANHPAKGEITRCLSNLETISEDSCKRCLRSSDCNQWSKLCILSNCRSVIQCSPSLPGDWT